MAGCSSAEISQFLGRKTLRLHRSRSLHSPGAVSPSTSGHSWSDAVPLRRRSLSLGARCLEGQVSPGSPDLQLWDNKAVEERSGGSRNAPSTPKSGCRRSPGEPEFGVYKLVRSPGVTCLRSGVRVSAGPSSAKKSFCAGQ
ncbi:uncharacterized protein LOC125942766 [Dermacentor silvarum]|uniref:uncharacterized protein LOC125942766 n=1 Tax=Dermacentor silvarum TaxID=543639 RepID=UPI002100A373|nr:uncharacterized protein LOC125942766 [Dermacentor silvarum]